VAQKVRAGSPLAIDGKVIIGVSGAETGIRGFIDAYDAKTGKRAWRFHTIPSPDDKADHAKKALTSWEGKSWMTGGGSAWVTGTYDPKLNTLYWGVGNPSPDFNGEVRKGDNLYTCSIVALNPDNGTYKWHFQNSPHDVWDYDGVNEPLLVDIEKDGKRIRYLIGENAKPIVALAAAPKLGLGLNPLGLVAAGLIVGKPLGVTLLCYVAVAIGLCRLPAGLNWRTGAPENRSGIHSGIRSRDDPSEVRHTARLPGR
jgi:outer membrane protein assembly factor BamB